jgi:hypothetical protein
MSHQNRAGAGYSEKSFWKHEVACKAATGQLAMARKVFPAVRMVIVDGNAGEGMGVEPAQPDMFMDVRSESTPELAVRLGREFNCDVVLCEKRADRRLKLTERFGRETLVTILDDHGKAPAIAAARSYQYALTISDPCGPSGHGVEQFLQRISHIVERSDFITILNMKFLFRLDGVHTPNKGWDRSKELYSPMRHASYWMQALGRRRASQTEVFNSSNGFSWRMFVIANHLSSGATRRPFSEVLS